MESEQKNEKSFQNPGIKILQQILDKKLWRLKDDNSKNLHETSTRIQDENAVLNIAQKEMDLELAKYPETKIQLTDNKELTEKAKRALNKFVSFLTTSNVLPKEAVMLTSKFSRGSDIEITDGRGGLNLDRRYDSGEFPQSTQERPLFTIGTGILKKRAGSYLLRAKEIGKDISEEQAINIAIYAIAAHEWGHSVERALATKYKSITRSIPENIKTEVLAARPNYE